MVKAPLAEGVVGRAIGRGLIDVGVHDLRDFTTDRHRVVDDMPFGGGPGMVMKPEPFFAAVEYIRRERGTPDAIVLTSPDGERFTHRDAERLSGLGHVVMSVRPVRRRRRAGAAASRHRGAVDRRLRALGRRVAGAGDARRHRAAGAGRRRRRRVGGARFVCRRAAGLPAVHAAGRCLQGHEVPAVLLSGHHAAIARWRRREALARTLARRPDLLETAALDDDDRELLRRDTKNDAGF